MKITPASQPNVRMAVVAIVDADDRLTVDKLRTILPDGALHRICMPTALQVVGHDSAVSPRTLPLLTERQAAIVPLLMTDLSNKEIGRLLGISHFTVRNHISQILRALEVPSRKAARAVLSNIELVPQSP